MSGSIWKPYVASPAMPWKLLRANHLHRRAAFGATWSELQRDVGDGPEKSVSRLLAGEARSDGLRDDFEEISQVIGEAATSSSDANRLKAWWLFRMLFTPDPLREKLTLLWHNHFATSNLKVQDLLLMRKQNELFRQHAAAKFGDLLRGVLRDPAMLVWLDANSNRQGHPNENLARELMELFTLGVGHFSEDDVKETARALTGWTTKRDQVQFHADRHDDGEKTILGQTANFDVDGLGKLLLDHKATGQRLAWRICDMLMGEGVVGDDAMAELVSGLRASDLDVAWAVETILRSELFLSDANIAARVSSPVEFVLGAVRPLELMEKPPSTLILADWCERLGQDLFYPPNVGGWKGGRGWLTSRTIVGRSNFAAALVAGGLRAPAEPPNLRNLVTKCGASESAGSSFEFFAALLLSAPVAAGGIGDLRGKSDLGELVAHLLSRPEAQLI